MKKRRIINYKEVVSCILEHEIWEISPILPEKVRDLRRLKIGKKIFCPFHKEKIPSFQWVLDKNFFCCFGCGKQTTIISYFAKVKGISYFKAVVILAKFFKIKIQWINVH